MATARVSVPKYCHFRPRDLAYVRIRGRVRYLGKYGSSESKEEYRRVLAELDATPTGVTTNDSSSADQTFTVAELCAAYLDFAQSYYVKDGHTTDQMGNVRRSIRLLNQLYSCCPARDVGPLALRAIQEYMVKTPHVHPKTQKAVRYSRGTINSTCDCIQRIFKWAVSLELVPAATYQALATVPGLKRGRTAAREPDPVLPVEDSIVEATLPYLTEVVGDMVRFQRMTGCRPGEVCQLRPMDLDRSREVWEYRPASHKTEHHGKARVIFIGPQAQAILLPYLLREATAYCFSPAESETKRHAEQRVCRRTRVQPSQQKRRKSRHQRPPKDHYTKDSYNRAMQRGCETAFGMPKNLRRIPGTPPIKELRRLAQLPVKQRQTELDHFHEDRKRRLYEAAQWRAKYCWSPNQLRHTRATEIRRQFGLEASQVVLGHARADVTQIYAERDHALAAEVMRKIG